MRRLKAGSRGGDVYHLLRMARLDGVVDLGVQSDDVVLPGSPIQVGVVLPQSKPAHLIGVGPGR